MSEIGPAPARPARLRSTIDRTPGVLRIRCPVRAPVVGCFMMLWLTGWTVGCVVLAGVVLVKREWFVLLFALPFWSSWIFVFFMMLKSFLQVDELVVDSGGGDDHAARHHHHPASGDSARGD